MSYNPVISDVLIAGATAQTATVNNILTSTSGAAATDTLGYKSFSVQVTSTGTAGTFIFEGSNDNTNFQPIAVYNQGLATSTAIISAITASASQIVYVGTCNTRYLRLRIATTITGGSIAANTTLRQSSLTPIVQNVGQSVAADHAVTATIASGTVTTVSTVTALSAINSVATTNGLSLGTVVTAATPAVTGIKTNAGSLHHMTVSNPNVTAVYLKIFNATTASLGTTSATMNYLVPANSATPIYIGDQGLYFSTGILIAVTGGISLTDNTAISSGCAVSYSWI